MKTSNKKFHIGEIGFPRYRENDKICVITCMKEYLKLTANYRGNITRLFITPTKPYKIAAKDTLARWIETKLQPAGIDLSIFTPHSTRSASTSIDLSIFTPHSTRSASTSRAATRGGWGGGGGGVGGGRWRSMRTFAKHYNDTAKILILKKTLHVVF